MSINVFFSVFNRLKKGILRSILSFLEIFLSLKVYLSDLIVLHWSGSQIPIKTNISKPAMVPCPQISTSIDGENQRIKKLPSSIFIKVTSEIFIFFAIFCNKTSLLNSLLSNKQTAAGFPKELSLLKTDKKKHFYSSYIFNSLYNASLSTGI